MTRGLSTGKMTLKNLLLNPLTAEFSQKNFVFDC